MSPPDRLLIANSGGDAIRRKLARFTDLVSALAAGNAPVAPGSILRYQAAALARGAVHLPSPIDGTEQRAVGSVRFRDNRVAYLFGGRLPFWVVSEDVAAGRSLAAVYFPRHRACVSLDEVHPGADMLDFLDVQPISGSGRSEVPAILPLLGHPNFAHHAWNELSPTLRHSPHLARGRQLHLSHQPLVDLQRALPDTTIRHVVAENEGLRHDALWLPLGGSLLSADCKKLVRRLCEEELTRDEHGVLADARSRPVNIWVSVRSHNRTLLGQVETLAALSHGILAQHPRASIVLDGFSLPRDFASNPNYRLARDTQAYPQIADATAAIAEAVIGQVCGDRRAVRERFIDATAARLPLSICLAHTCSFYVCHHGTQQHKIGWFCDVGGVVHSNRTVLGLRPAKWVAEQSEGAVPPHYVAEKDVVDSSEDGHLPPYFHSYSMTSVRGVLDVTNLALAGSDMPVVADRPGVINQFTREFAHCRYLEIGLFKAETFLQVRAAEKVGVDVAIQFDRAILGDKGVAVHEMRSDEFFATSLSGRFDVVFIDGLHTFEQVLRDFHNALAALSSAGVIIVDDALPTSYIASIGDPNLVNRIRRPGNPFHDGTESWMGDVYKLAYFLEAFHPMIEFHLVQETRAQIVCWRRPAARPVTDPTIKVDAIARIEYAHLMADVGRLRPLPLPEIRARYREDRRTAERRGE